MAIQTSITRKFDNNYVQVEVSSKKQEPRYYKVPEADADSFQREYKKNSKKMPWINAGLLLGAIAGTIIPLSYLTKKIQSKGLRTLIGVIAGLGGGIGSMILGASIELKSYNKLLKKYNAEEIDYTKSKLPI